MTTGAGTSALVQYRAARAQRRARSFLAALFLAGGVAELVNGWGFWPVAVTLVAAAGLLLWARLAAGGGDLGRWRRGALGERMTADLLAALPSRRWRVWHDLRVPGSRANIDHVVVGRTGVWVVDTKTTRAPVHTGWRSVSFGSRRLDVSTTRWEAAALSDALTGCLGYEWADPVEVRPLIVVHGDGLPRRGRKVSGVPVVPADQLVGRLQRGRRRLGRGQIGMVADAMNRAFSGSLYR